VFQTAVPRDPEEVSICWNAGQMRASSMTTPSPGERRIVLGDRLDPEKLRSAVGGWQRASPPAIGVGSEVLPELPGVRKTS